MLYLTIITLIFYRFTFVALTVDQGAGDVHLGSGTFALHIGGGARRSAPCAAAVPRSRVKLPPTPS
jgi:hypothetical protein